MCKTQGFDALRRRLNTCFILCFNHTEAESVVEDSSKVPDLEVVDEEVIDAPVEEAVLESCPDAELEVKVFPLGTVHKIRLIYKSYFREN